MFELEARLAALAGTRQLIADETLNALAGFLVARNVCSGDEAADLLIGLSQRLIEIARGRLQTEFALYPAELFDRAASLMATAATLRSVPDEAASASARQ